MNKKIAVLWSGGLDSTYLIFKNLQEGNSVTSYYVNIENNKEKTICEKNAIRKISKIFKLYDFKDGGDIFKIKIFQSSNIFLKQVPLFIVSLVYLSDFDSVQIAYCKNDDAISYLNEIKKIFYSFKGISHNKLPKLEFPLMKEGKEDYYNLLPKEIRKNIWYCENPHKMKPCNKCSPCERHNRIIKK